MSTKVPPASPIEYLREEAASLWTHFVVEDTGSLFFQKGAEWDPALRIFHSASYVRICADAKPTSPFAINLNTGEMLLPDGRTFPLSAWLPHYERIRTCALRTCALRAEAKPSLVRMSPNTWTKHA